MIVGGLPRYLWGTTASPVTSSEGFLGCVGNIQLNGNTMFLQQKARQIEKGCSGPLVACRKCSNCKIVDNSISLFSRKTICGLSKDDIWEIITAISRQLVNFIITRKSGCIFNECRILKIRVWNIQNFIIEHGPAHFIVKTADFVDKAGMGRNVTALELLLSAIPAPNVCMSVPEY